MLSREWKYILLIIVIFISACIETDIYLPAFTDMMAFFSISEEKIQSLLTWNFIGICLAGPFYGPISDSLGRKKPLIFALGLFLIGSIFTLFAQDFDLMLLGRVLQGLGSGGCFTLGTAIIFDAFKEQQAVQALNRINSIVPFIFASAPMLGGYLNNIYGFRSNFLAIAIIVFISFMICLFWFDETLPSEKRSPFRLKKIIGDFKKVSLSVPFWQTTMIVCLSFSGYLAFLSTISVLYILEFGIEKQSLPYHQAALLGAWLVANLLFNQILSWIGVAKVKLFGTLMILTGGTILIASAWAVPENPYFFTGAMMIFAVGVNWTQGLYFPEGMELFPEIKGVSASLLTSIRLLMAAIVVAIASTFYDGTIYPIVTIECILIAVILATILLYEKKKPITGLIKNT